MKREERARQLIERIYQAAVEPAAWNEFAQDLSAAYDGAAVVLSLNLPGDPLARRRYAVGLLEEFLESYLRRIIEGLPWSSTFAANFMGRFGDAVEVFPDEDIRQTGFYTQWMKPQNLAPVWPIVHTIATDDGVPVGGLTVFRPSPGEAFGSEDLAFGDLLVSHLTRGVGIYITLSGIQRESLALAEVVDRLPTGVILLDTDRRPVVTNRSAERVIALDDGFKLGPHGPCAASARENAALQKLVANALETAPGRELEASGLMAISRPSGKRAFPTLVTPLLSAPPESSVREAVVAIFIANPETDQISTTAVLETLYSLTHAEAELVRLLSEGHSLEDAAKMRGVTINTARSHLKRVFAKTDTKRQGELVRLVLTGVASIRDE